MNAKRAVTRILINNWGKFSTHIERFHPDVNGVFGTNGSGKSTLLDAFQVILYGDLHNDYLNAGAEVDKDIAKRSILTYLRGDQHNAPPLRENKSFSTVLALEIVDQMTGNAYCCGVVFDVVGNKQSIDDHQYFTMYGLLPEDGFIKSDNTVYRINDVKELLEQRQKMFPKTKHKLCQMYITHDAYRNNLDDYILNIPGKRKEFSTMMKNVIKAKLAKGLPHFIETYLFMPDDDSEIIDKTMEQLQSYKSLLHTIEDLKERRDLLKEEVDAWSEYKETDDLIKYTENAELYAKIVMTEQKICEKEEERNRIINEQPDLQKKKEEYDRQLEEIHTRLVDIEAHLKNGLEPEKERLKNLYQKQETELENYKEWKECLNRLEQWCEEEKPDELMSSQTKEFLLKFGKKTVTEDDLNKLTNIISEITEEIGGELDDQNSIFSSLRTRVKEAEEALQKAKSGKKNYKSNLTDARNSITEYLHELYHGKGEAFVLGDLFDITDETWANAVEGIFGKKLSLVTEPKYAMDAMKKMRELNCLNPEKYGGIKVIDTKSITENNLSPKTGSLYDVVFSDLDYVKDVLKYYLGKIIRCDSVEELQRAGNGVTADCCAYSDYAMQTILKHHYDKPTIGTRISPKRIKQMEEELSELQSDFHKQKFICEKLKQAHDYKFSDRTNTFLIRLSNAENVLEQCSKDIEEKIRMIEDLEKNKYGKMINEHSDLKQKWSYLDDQKNKKRNEYDKNESEILNIGNDIMNLEQNLGNYESEYVPDHHVEEETKHLLQTKKHDAVISYFRNECENARSRLENVENRLNDTRYNFSNCFPAHQLDRHNKKSNEAYQKLYEMFSAEYDEKYHGEFEKQKARCYHELEQHIMYRLHNAIRNANVQKKNINRMLHDVAFGNSKYRIEISKTNDEAGQFYDMLTASELDFKHNDYSSDPEQFSLGEDQFYQNYQSKVDAFMETILPKNDPTANAEYNQLQRENWKKTLQKYMDFRSYLDFDMQECERDRDGKEVWRSVLAKSSSGGEDQNVKYVALFIGFATMYASPLNNESTFRLILADEAFSKMDNIRRGTLLDYARKLGLQIILCRPEQELPNMYKDMDSICIINEDENGYVGHWYMSKITAARYVEDGLNIEDMETDEDEIFPTTPSVPAPKGPEPEQLNFFSIKEQ